MKKLVLSLAVAFFATGCSKSPYRNVGTYQMFKPELPSISKTKIETVGDFALMENPFVSGNLTRIWSIDLASRQILWNRIFENNGFHRNRNFDVSGDTVYTTDFNIETLDIKTGELKNVIDDDGRLICDHDEKSLYCTLSTPDGSDYFDSVMSVDRKSGKPNWKTRVEIDFPYIIAGNDFLTVFSSHDNQFVMLDKLTGKIIRYVQMDDGRFYPNFDLPAEIVYQYKGSLWINRRNNLEKLVDVASLGNRKITKGFLIGGNLFLHLDDDTFERIDADTKTVDFKMISGDNFIVDKANTVLITIGNLYNKETDEYGISAYDTDDCRLLYTIPTTRDDLPVVTVGDELVVKTSPKIVSVVDIRTGEVNQEIETEKEIAGFIGSDGNIFGTVFSDATMTIFRH